MTLNTKHQKIFDEFMNGIVARNPAQPEFHQAVHEVAATVIPAIDKHPQLANTRILDRITEPDRIIIFPIMWEDDNGNMNINRGYRVQFNNAIGPYKGGLRFHPSVNISIFKFLGFEQIFKNALTTLPMGGAKGGSDFNPKGRSDSEVRRFCQEFMTELQRHIGADIDIPAGDIGVGARELGYLFGHYKKLRNVWDGGMTGKGLNYGGSQIRTEATGYGLIYFLDEMMKANNLSLEGKTATVSGSGNVSLYAMQKLEHLGAKAITASDSSGFVHDPDGINGEKLEWLRDLKENRRGRVSEYAEKFGCEFFAGQRPWNVPCDLALPCATENEIDSKDAANLVKNGVIAVAEGANMPTPFDAIRVFRDAGVLYAPSKATNAGGVAVSGLEQSQNSMRLSWPRDQVDQRLREIMTQIHATCAEHGASEPNINYVMGANVAGFLKVADAMVTCGYV